MLPIPSRYIVVAAVGHHPPVYSLQVYNDFILSLGCCPYPADTLLWRLGHHPPMYSLQVYNDFILSLRCCPYPADTLLWRLGHHPPVHSLQVYNDFILSLGCCPYPADTLLWLLWATIHLCIHYRFIMSLSYLWGAAHTQQIHCCGDSGPPSTCAFTTGL